MEFAARYKKLNAAQKQAVDAIDGPVMVIAGPGTGKTELLSVRVANILQKTDTLPENILCLTFTDSGANAMRDRLTQIIGKDAYKVAIHTFHSFGSEVINQNGQFFYQGAQFMPADELSSYEILNSIFSELDYSNPIAKKMNNEYTYLPDSKTVISELKKSGLTSDELLKILDCNDIVIEKMEQLLSPILANRISKNTIPLIASHIQTIRDIDSGVNLPTIVPLSKVLSDSLEESTNEAEAQNSTKPITAWRNRWFKKNEKGDFILKSRERQIKLRAISYVYNRYLTMMQESALYDFDDMILRVVHAMEVFDDLRFNLQEKYQYIMVDEFQDTNMAQMRILHNLTNNIAQGDTPNILVVGDDDQAIYSFQGADISNILDFKSNYPKSKLITLTDNYRSVDNILSGARDIILQGQDRLESKLEGINKKLTAHSKSDNIETRMFEADIIGNERHFVVNDIRQRIKSGVKPNNIAVLTRRHHEIISILPYFSRAGIEVNYERQDNALDVDLIVLIEKIARILIDIEKGRHDEVNAKLPEIISHAAWGYKPSEIWDLSLKAYDTHTRWLDLMATTPRFAPFQTWLIETALLISYTPLEVMLDMIIGKTTDKKEGFVSPIYEYFFSADKIHSNANEYLFYLEAIRTIRTKLREYHPNKNPNLATFIEFIELNRKIGSNICVVRHQTKSDGAINIMTTHKSKGLEFDTVYIINAVDSAWGERARSRNHLISYPENLPLAPSGETFDERLRLFYVACTRAKNQLNISYSLADDSGRNTLRAAFLIDSKWRCEKIPPHAGSDQQIEAAELAWYQPIVDRSSSSLKELLLPELKDYRLSVTHLHNFLDVSRGGPETFLLQNLLHFPQAKNSNASFGTAVHDTLQNAHSYVAANGSHQAVEDIVSLFERNLRSQHLSKQDFQIYLKRGSDALRSFLDDKYSTFHPGQQTELNFAGQHSIVNTAHITGKLDLAEIDRKQKIILVTDYKTGKPSTSWQGKTEFEKIKLHKYKQQLMFYKLLVENARDYHDYKVTSGIMQYVEPTISGDIIALDIEYNTQELEHFTQLINAVWQRITNFDLPGITEYDKSLKGILAFEQDLIDNL